MRGLGILPAFRRYNSATVVILLGTCRIDAAYHQPQPASLSDSPREKSEIVEHVFFNLSGHYRLGLAQRLAVSCSHRRASERHRSSVRQNLVEIRFQIRVR